MVESISMKNILKTNMVFKAVVKKVRKSSTYKKGDLVWVRNVSQTNNRSNICTFQSSVIVLNNKKEFAFRLLSPVTLDCLVDDKTLSKKTPFFFL